MSEVMVPSQRIDQEQLHYCGPAVAQMILAALGVATPATPPTWQDQLYDYIVKHTGRTKRPRNAPDLPAAPQFPNQKCERCSTSDPFTCWSTTPNALRNVLNNKQTVAKYAVNQVSSEATATDRVLDTIDRGFPAAALVYGWQHWVMVDGYLEDEADSTVVTGRNLNGVYIRDPKDTESDVHYVEWEVWRRDYVNFVPCGVHKNKMVVLSATAP